RTFGRNILMYQWRPMGHRRSAVLIWGIEKKIVIQLKKVASTVGICRWRRIENNMKVLVACEEAQVVCIAFRERGHEAYSCDIQECSGGHPEWHIHGD